MQGHAYNTDVPDIVMYRRALFTYISTHVICLKRSSARDRHPIKIDLAQQTEATVSIGENALIECCPMRQQYENQILILNTNWSNGTKLRMVNSVLRIIKLFMPHNAVRQLPIAEPQYRESLLATNAIIWRILQSRIEY